MTQFIRMRVLGTAALLALTVATAGPAEAAQTYRSKEVYLAADRSVPPLAQSYLRAHPEEAIQVNSFTRIGMPSVNVFHAFSPVSHSAAGVCRFTRTEIFPHRAANGDVTWDSTPEKRGERVDPVISMALISDLPCPRQNEEIYASLDGDISDELFVEIVQFWSEISASQDAFDRATGLLPFILRPAAADKLSEFRSSLFQPNNPPLRVRAVWRDNIDAYSLAVMRPGADRPAAFLALSKSLSGYEMVNFQSPY